MGSLSPFIYIFVVLLAMQGLEAKLRKIAEIRLDAPNNFGSGLRQLVHTHKHDRHRDIGKYISLRNRGFAKEDSVLVYVLCDGTRDINDVISDLEQHGVEVQNKLRSYRTGILAAYMSLDVSDSVSSTPGVQSVSFAHRPRRRAFKPYVDPAIRIHRVQEYTGLLTGRNITVGIMSDSFNALGGAQADILAAELPGAGNPKGHTTPVVVVQDYLHPENATDEGRAMLQLVYDLAPDARLCFATAFDEMINMHDNIIALAGPPCNADIIVDDVGYPEEALYSDSILAEAVDTVFQQGVVYVSSAGNERGQSVEMEGYFEDAADVFDTHVYSGWQVFDQDAEERDAKFVTEITVQSGTDIYLQWNDPWHMAGKISLDLDLFVFGANNKAFKSDDRNQQTLEPIEFIGDLEPGTYDVAVARYPLTGSHPRSFQETLIYLFSDEPVGPDSTSFDVGTSKTPAIWGHTTADGSIAVAAYQYFDLSAPAYYSSPGPAYVFFTSKGLPFYPPEVRRSPDIATVDCTDTTFFGQRGEMDVEHDGLPNFCGTSSAAPHCAGLVALLLEAAGGPRSMTPAAVKTALIRSTGGAVWDQQAGFGLVDGGAALRVILADRSIVTLKQSYTELFQITSNLNLNPNQPVHNTTEIQELSSSVASISATIQSLSTLLNAAVYNMTTMQSQMSAESTALSNLQNHLQQVQLSLSELNISISNDPVPTNRPGPTVPPAAKTASSSSGGVANIALAFGGGAVTTLAAGGLVFGMQKWLRLRKRQQEVGQFELLPIGDVADLGDEPTASSSRQTGGGAGGRS
mmetsp:Transcript_28292/g.45830  ORF Transcript_28292/g.45830 Transcript_28292/m.45830 type:complete len:802 (+) Transcript_28292:98-2503(+)